MAQPPQACAPCPTHYAVLQGAYARYTNTLIVLERALYLRATRRAAAGSLLLGHVQLGGGAQAMRG